MSSDTGGVDSNSELDGFINLGKDASFDIQHVFHQECLKEWFDSNTRCPICNFNTTSSALKM